MFKTVAGWVGISFYVVAFTALYVVVRVFPPDTD